MVIQSVIMNEKQLSAMRHSLAHIMAAALTRLYPDTQLGTGPATENGFYYDFDLPTTLGEDDFAAIENEMKKIIFEDQPFERLEMSTEEAKEWAKKAKQPYKLELLDSLNQTGAIGAKGLDVAAMASPNDGHATDRVSFYKNGEFVDLCRGPHVESTGKVGAFKVMRVSGAYWRGQDTNPQMQRLYGVAFATQEELDKYLAMLEEAKRRDHRKLGQELDLFVLSDMVGAGLPMFTPRGTVLREELAAYSNELRQRRGFEKVWIPHMTKKELYETSGHWAKFGNELFLVKSQETSDQFVLKPMNCPHHTRIYAARQRSYRDLPVRYLETTTVYRDEKTGELNGLSRVRSVTQDDSHVFCRNDQIETEINNLLEAARELYGTVGMDLRVRLSYRDNSDAYLGDKKLWESAQEQLKSAVAANKLDYIEEEGEAAFYGPKIDFMATDAIGREHQVATVQLDFVMPERFGLEYTSEDGSKPRPVMIHCALLGSIERFLSVYIEHTAGHFPVWLAPEQLRLIQVKEDARLSEFVKEIKLKADEQGVRTVVDNTDATVGKKIRQAELMKIPYVVVVGEKELSNGILTPRVRQDLAVENRKGSALSIEHLVKSIANEARGRASKSSL